jgi:hypothetical protein
MNAISIFLHKKKKDLGCSYKSLTLLSDSSRVEALDALHGLSQRLSQSLVSLRNPRQRFCGRYASWGRENCASVNVPPKTKRLENLVERHEGKQKSDAQNLTAKKGHHRAKSAPELRVKRHSGTRGKQTTKGAWVRKRQSSASSTISSLIRPSTRAGSDVSGKTSPTVTPGTSSPRQPIGFPTPFTASATRHEPPSSPMTRKAQALLPAPDSFSPRTVIQSTQLTKPIPRRQDKPTPSVFSFASDSTKVGEIPEHKWAHPSYFQGDIPNFPVTVAFPIDTGYREQAKGKPRSKFFRMFRKPSKTSNVVAAS